MNPHDISYILVVIKYLEPYVLQYSDPYSP